MTPADFLKAARVPGTLKPQRFGPWRIKRYTARSDAERTNVEWPDFTILTHKVPATMATLHLSDEDGTYDQVVMEDSAQELRQHLPIWLQASGRVLVTGLGLGCVVRGLLASPAVEHIDVVEIDSRIIRVIGLEFAGNRRVAIHHADALTFEPPANASWDYAWHDIWTEGNEGLQLQHAAIIDRFKRRCPRHGAWKFPRFATRLAPELAGVR